jgi:uncharacterized membrane protein
LTRRPAFENRQVETMRSIAAEGGAMIRILRKVGIAVGSLVAAFFAVGLLSGWILPWFGVTPSNDPRQVAVLTVITIVVGGLFYRDIIRYEQRMRKARDEMRRDDEA